MKQNINTLVKTFTDRKVLVVGEAILDVYFQGLSDRLSREAPVPIVDVTDTQELPGGAANVAMNTSALGADTVFLSVTGDDKDADILRRLLTRSGIKTEYVFRDRMRKTLAKKRVLSSDHMLVRFDSGSTDQIKSQTESVLIDALIDLWSEADTVIISDYGYGVITDAVISVLQKLQKALPRTLMVDSKELDRFSEVNPTVVKPNYNEAVRLLGLTRAEKGERRVAQIEQQKEQILEIVNSSIAAVTLDSEGALIFDRSGPTYRTYAKRVENPKVIGAGDTYVAAFSLCLSSELDVKTSAEIAAVATKVIITKDGTACCSAKELHDALTKNEKIITDRRKVFEIVRFHRNQGKRIVFTNGCFDLLHTGHVTYLNKAKSFGELLIIGVNTDESVKKLKGPERPINNLGDRMQILSALSSVSYVVPMPEKTASELVSLIKPDVYVKGGDYTFDRLPEAQIVFSYDGQVELIPLVEGRSTTDIIKKIRTETVNQKIQL